MRWALSVWLCVAQVGAREIDGAQARVREQRGDDLRPRRRAEVVVRDAARGERAQAGQRGGERRREGAAELVVAQVERGELEGLACSSTQRSGVSGALRE